MPNTSIANQDLLSVVTQDVAGAAGRAPENQAGPSALAGTITEQEIIRQVAKLLPNLPAQDPTTLQPEDQSSPSKNSMFNDDMS